jgi:hypothetical protein
MKIPHPLPQFENTTALLMVSGEFEAHFYIARNGFIERRQIIQHIPREEVIGKDWGLTGNSERATPFGAVSSTGIRKLNLKKKFREEVAHALDEMALYNNVQEIYLLGPHHVTLDILRKLGQPTKAKIRGKYDGEYTKDGPIRVLEIIYETKAKPKPTLQTKTEKKILNRPKTGSSKTIRREVP